MTPPHPILENDFASQWLGIEVQETTTDKAVITMTVRKEMLNGFGIAHGGMLFAFADTAFALACNSPEEAGKTITVASGADINFVSSPIEGQLITATAHKRASTGRSGIYDVTITAEDHSIIAEFRGRCRTIKPKK